MTAVLVSLAEAKAFIENVPAAHDETLQAILDGVEDLFLSETNRRERPFLGTTDTVTRTEVKDGTGSSILTLDYPISALANDIVLGRNTSNPDETLEYDDVDVMVFVAGKRTVQRTDGGCWGYADSPRYVHVTYKAAADIPASGALAIKRVCAQVYRQRGSEDASSESVGGFYSRDLVEVASADPIWRMAVASEWSPRL